MPIDASLRLPQTGSCPSRRSQSANNWVHPAQQISVQTESAAWTLLDAGRTKTSPDPIGQGMFEGPAAVAYSSRRGVGVRTRRTSSASASFFSLVVIMSSFRDCVGELVDVRGLGAPGNAAVAALDLGVVRRGHSASIEGGMVALALRDSPRSPVGAIGAGWAAHS